jgi:hypothetical protein
MLTFTYLTLSLLDFFIVVTSSATAIAISITGRHHFHHCHTIFCFNVSSMTHSLYSPFLHHWPPPPSSPCLYHRCLSPSRSSATTTISSSVSFRFIRDDVRLLPELLAINLDRYLRLAWSLEFKKVILAIEILKKRTTTSCKSRSWHESFWYHTK